MENIPDHPDIARALRTGYPYGEEDEKIPICPECGQEAEIFYLKQGNVYGDILGCNNCVKKIDSWRWEAFL